MRLLGLPLSHLVQHIPEGPMGLECDLGPGARHLNQPGQLGVGPVRQGFG